MKKDLSKLSYQELEEEANETLKKLGEVSLGLDEAAKLYEYGKMITKEMSKRLEELTSSVSDEIEQE
ncbi:MAG: hypothetical protein IJ194_08340 [Bacilli bacterium]|nr:hypothetical protein [Bacilli bacterium]